MIQPGEQIYDIKREYESEDEAGGGGHNRHKIVELGKIQYKGTGPRTKDGKNEPNWPGLF